MITKFLQYIQYRKNYSSYTVLSYQHDIEEFQQFLLSHYQLPVEKAEADHIRDWLVNLRQQKLSVTSINRKLSSLKSFYKYLLRTEVIDSNPADTLTSLKKPQRLPTFFKESEMDAALEENPFETSDDFPATRDKIVLEIFYQTGCRRSELIQLKDGDFNFFSLTLRIRGKGNKERLVPFSASLKEKIEHYIKVRNQAVGNTPYFIVTDKGEQAYPNLIYRIVHNKMGEVSSLTKRSPHVIRHTFASELLNNGADINAVKELLGHASLAATEVYTHTSFEQLKESYKKALPRK